MAASALHNKVVWLTGASSGIGEALCLELAGRGAKLVLSSRRADVLESVRTTLPNAQQHFVLPLDMLAPDSFAAAYQTVRDQVGDVDVLINCAGLSQRANAVDTDLNVDRQIMESNYFAAVALTKLVLPSMLARRAGQIVAVSSLMGKFGLPGRTAYSASKHALHGFFDSLRAEVADFGVTVTVVCPGYIRTNAAFNALDGHGAPSNKQDSDIAGGLDPKECARQTVRAIEHRRPEVYVARYEKFGLYIHRFFPALFRRIARRKARSRRS